MQQAPGYFRFSVGSATAIALHDGVIERDYPKGFVRNASDGEVGAAFAEAGMAEDKLTLTFTPLLIDNGSHRVLIDTGFGAGGPPGTGQLAANLEAAGIAPESIDVVVISHFHSDHIAGLRRADGSPAFPRARIAVPQPEWDFWMDDAKVAAGPDALKPHAELARKTFGPIANDVQRFAWDEAFLPGFTAVDAHGHTPGMSAIEFSSGDHRLLYVADIVNNPLVFARHPSWQAMFDFDGDAATMTRRRLFDRAAQERLRLSFYHAPFPATGYIAKNGDAYEYLPALWRA